MTYRYCPYDGKLLTGRGLHASRVTACNLCGFVDYQNPKACVGIFILQQNQVLLAKRGIEPAKGAWDIPGGFVEKGESSEKAVLREAYEETTMRVRNLRFLGSFPDTYGDKKTPVLTLCYIVDVVRGIPTPKSDVE